MLNLIQEIEQINRDIARLQIKREELTQDIIKSLGHDHEGQRSYDVDIYRVEVRTPMVYSLDKVMYESGEVYIPSDFDPVRKKTSYDIDKKSLAIAMDSAPESVRDALTMLIDKKPGKPSVTVKVRS